MTADRARGALAVLQDADGKFICEVPCGYIVEQTASAHKPRRIQAQRRRRAMLRRRVALTVALLTVAALLAALMPWSGSGEYLHNADENENAFCGQCGQAIKWGCEDED